MKGQVRLCDVTMDVGTSESLHLDVKHWGAVLGSSFARFACAILLLIAASLKAYQLFTDPALGVLHGSRWLQTVLVDYELLLATWLLSGVNLRWGRRITLVTFLGFACYALFLGLSGKASCGCFGKVPISPWWSFSIDVALALMLFIWRPQIIRVDFGSEPKCARFAARPFLAILAAIAVIGVPTLSIVFWQLTSDSSLESSLANSRFVLLEPEKWIGKPFPLTEYIDVAEPEHLSQGSWILLFYHYDCPKCQEALPRYERLAEEPTTVNEETKIMLIEIPPYGPSVFSANPVFYHGRLSESKEWLITTPAEVRIKNGQVIAASSGLVPESQ
jgi:thiol-disulfide isomerase/thioredoxin